jgi:hypothetical protein
MRKKGKMYVTEYRQKLSKTLEETEKIEGDETYRALKMKRKHLNSEEQEDYDDYEKRLCELKKDKDLFGNLILQGIIFIDDINQKSKVHSLSTKGICSMAFQLQLYPNILFPIALNWSIKLI